MYDITCIPEQPHMDEPPQPHECEPEFPPFEQACPFWLENIDTEWIALSDRTGWTPQLIHAVADTRCPNMDCIQGWVQSGYSYRRCHVCDGTGRQPCIS